MYCLEGSLVVENTRTIDGKNGVSCGGGGTAIFFVVHRSRGKHRFLPTQAGEKDNKKKGINNS